MARLSIRLLGSFKVALDGQPVTAFESDKVRALLAYLAVESERSHRRESLAGLLWPDYPERSARTNLRGALANLRQAIGDRHTIPPFLHISRQTIQFNSESNAWVDVRAFSDLVESQAPSGDAIQQLEEAVEFYEGSFLEGFSLPDSPAFEEWALLERERLERMFREALLQLAGAHEERGETEAALRNARRLLELDPLVEEAHRQVMRALEQSGERAAALAQYEALCQVLESELGAEPAPETTLLYERILNGEIGVPAPAADPPRHNLPVQLTPFVGRTGELAELRRLLENPEVRLITVLGPGGMGKTRLALEAAAAQLDRFERGVFFVSLASLGSAEGIVPAVADALGFSFYAGGEPQQQLLDYLRGKNLLLVMDHYEHLLEGASLVSDVLRAAPAVKVMATSRARLNL